MSTLAVDAKDWGNKRKVAARKLLIEICQQALGRQKVARDRQYWTICGQLFDSDTKRLKPWCEYDHVVLRHHFATPEQFIGVEKNRAICRGNRKALPHVQFYADDIARAVCDALREDRFHPSVVNLDTTSEPERAVRLLCDVMDVINYVDGPVVLALNVILWCRLSNRRFTWDDFTNELARSDRFKMYFRHGWSQTRREETIDYDGSKATTMGTVVFIRKGRGLCRPSV